MEHEIKEDCTEKKVVKKSSLPEEFLQKIDSFGSIEEKLEYTLVFMQKALAGGGGHHFREFWDARKLCTDFFVHTIHPSMRVRLWAQYTDICHEARLLKEWFDEQSAFFIEQIEQAIGVVEAELPLFEEKGAHLPNTPELAACRAISKHLDRYEKLHHELQYLNSFASRISSLRKELLKTDMRYKSRHKLLERLSTLGDSVFPKRKQVMSEVSALFLADIEEFIQSTPFATMKPHALFQAREDIKHLQESAKILTLSTDAFTKTRERLSECWEKIKNILKELKKEEHEKKVLFKTHRDECIAAIEKIKAEVAEGKISSLEAKKALHSVSEKMRDMPLMHQDVRLIRDMIHEIEDSLPQQAESILSGKKEDKHHAFLERIRGAFAKTHVSELVAALQEFTDECSKCTLSRQEKVAIEKELTQLRGVILDALEKEPSLEILSIMRAQSKKYIDAWRKETSGSTSDFSIAMQYTELMDQEKLLLKRIETLFAREG